MFFVVMVFTMVLEIFSIDLSELWFNGWFAWGVLLVCWFLAPYVWAWTDGRRNKEDSESESESE
jgi:hypothetical protein